MITLIAVMSMFASRSHAGTPLACENIFESVPPEVYGSGPDRQTVRIAGIFRNSRGESFYILRRLLEETTWSSKFAPRGFDPQGDASVIFQVLGFPLARVLGFGWNQRGDILAPTPETLNTRIKAFNQFLRTMKIEPILATYYLQPKPVVEGFLLKWSDVYGNPVADGKSTHTIHDIVFHYMGGILLPPAITRLLSAEATFAAAWMRFNRQTRPEAAWTSAALIDRMSTSNNQYEHEEITADDLAAFLGNYIGADADEMPTKLKDFAARLTPLDVFHRKILIADDIAFGTPKVADEIALMKQHEAEPGHKAFFLAQMRREFPKLNKPLAKFGLTDFETVQGLYTMRTSELRHAAELFLPLAHGLR